MLQVDQTMELRDTILASRAARKTALSTLPLPDASSDRLSWCCLDDNGSTSNLSDDEDEESTIQGHQTTSSSAAKLCPTVSALKRSNDGTEHDRHSSAHSSVHPDTVRPSTTKSYRSFTAARGKPLGPPPTIPLPPRPDSTQPRTPAVPNSSRSFAQTNDIETDTGDSSADDMDSIRRLSSCFPSPGPSRALGRFTPAAPRSPTSSSGSVYVNLRHASSRSNHDMSDGEYEDVLQLTDHRGVLRAARSTASASRLNDARRDLGVNIAVSPTSPTGFRTLPRSGPKRVSSSESVMQQKITGLVAALDLHADQWSSSPPPSRSALEQVNSRTSSPLTPATSGDSIPSLASSSSLDVSHSLQRTDSTDSMIVPSISIAESEKSSSELGAIYDAYRWSNGSTLSHTFVPPALPETNEDELSDTEVESDSPRKRTKQGRAVIGLGFQDQRAVRRDSVTRTGRLGSAFSPSLQSTAEESSPSRPGTHDPYAFYEFSPSLPPFVPSGFSPKDLTGTGTWSSIVARAASHTLRSRQPSMASLTSVASSNAPISLRDIKAAAAIKQQLAEEERRQRESLSGYVSAMTYRPFALHDHAVSLVNRRESSPDTSTQSSSANGRTTVQSTYSLAGSNMGEFGTRWPVAIGEDQVEFSPSGSFVGFQDYSLSRPVSAQPKDYVEFCTQTSPSSSPADRKLPLPAQAGVDQCRAQASPIRRKSSTLSMQHNLDEPGAWPLHLRAPRLSSPNSASTLSHQSIRSADGTTWSQEDDQDESRSESEESDLDVSADLEVLAERSGVWDDSRGSKRKVGVVGKYDRHSLSDERKIASMPLRVPLHHHLSTALDQLRATDVAEAKEKDESRPALAPALPIGRSSSPELALTCGEDDELLTRDVNFDELSTIHASLLGEDEAYDSGSRTYEGPRFVAGRSALQGTPNTTAGSEIWSSFDGDRLSSDSIATTYSAVSSQEDKAADHTSASLVDVPAATVPTLRRKSSGLPRLAVPRLAVCNRSDTSDAELPKLPPNPVSAPMLRRPQSVANLKNSASKSPSSMLPSPTAGRSTITPSKLPSLRTVASATSLRSRTSALPLSPALKDGMRSGLPVVTRTIPLTSPPHH